MRLTGPMDRISEPYETEGVTFRKMTHGLVYFDLKSTHLKDRGEVTVKVIFRDNFPEGQKFMLGARKNESYSYVWKDIYVPFYETLKGYQSVKIDDKQMFLINRSVISGLDGIPEGSVLATNTFIDWNPFVESVEDDLGKKLSLNVSMRQGHTFYTYVDDGMLELNISKQDLNWYSGSDELKIEVYSFRDDLAGNFTIPDDGNRYNSSILGPVQKEAFSLSNLEKGVYRIKLLYEGDLFIRGIEINSGEFVTEGSLFLTGDNPAYFKDKNATKVEVYFKNPRNSTMRFKTWHFSGLQNISLNNNSVKLNISKINKWYNITLPASDELNTLTLEKGDVIIESINYFSLSKDSYFTPKKFKIVDIKPDIAWLKSNVDYVILEYNFIEGKEWKAGNESWNIDDLFIKDNTLSFGLNAPHLIKEEYNNYTIPIDKIEIEIKIPPIWERF